MCRIDCADDDLTMVRDEQVESPAAEKCTDCQRRIDPGEPHRQVVFAPVDDNGRPILGRPINCIQCAHCGVAARWLDEVCGGWLYDGIVEELDEHWDENWPYCTLGLGRLIVAARRGWLARRPSADELQAASWDVSKVLGARVPLDQVQRWVDEALAAQQRRTVRSAAAPQGAAPRLVWEGNR